MGRPVSRSGVVLPAGSAVPALVPPQATPPELGSLVAAVVRDRRTLAPRRDPPLRRDDSTKKCTIARRLLLRFVSFRQVEEHPDRVLLVVVAGRVREEVPLVVELVAGVPVLLRDGLPRDLEGRQLPRREKQREGVEGAARGRQEVVPEVLLAFFQQGLEGVVVPRLGEARGLDVLLHVPPLVQEGQRVLRVSDPPAAGVEAPRGVLRQQEVTVGVARRQKVLGALGRVHDDRVGVDPPDPLAALLQEQSAGGLDLEPGGGPGPIELCGLVEEAVAVLVGVRGLVVPGQLQEAVEVPPPDPFLEPGFLLLVRQGRQADAAAAAGWKFWVGDGRGCLLLLLLLCQGGVPRGRTVPLGRVDGGMNVGLVSLDAGEQPVSRHHHQKHQQQSQGPRLPPPPHPEERPRHRHHPRVLLVVVIVVALVVVVVVVRVVAVVAPGGFEGRHHPPDRCRV